VALPNIALLVDFDETASLDNVAEMLLTRFATKGWTLLQTRFRAGEIALREYQESAFAMVPASPQTMAEYAAEHARIRPGLRELVAACNAEGTPIAVVSGGLDFYVKSVLARNGLEDVTSFTVSTRSAPGGLAYTYPLATPTCWLWGNCKCSIVERHRADGRRVVYCGDGRNDVCPASKASFVFARKRLLEHCREAGLPHEPLEDFFGVIRAFSNPEHPIHACLNGRRPAPVVGGEQ